MKKISYWSPFLSNVATIKNVINSAISLKKYSNNYEVTIIDVMGEWSSFRKLLEENRIKVKNINNFEFNLPITGYFKSRFFSILIILRSYFSLKNYIVTNKPNYLIIHLITSLPLLLLVFNNFDTKFILRISGLPKINFLRKALWKLISKKVHYITCPSKETILEIKKKRLFDERKIKILYDPIIKISNINKSRNINNFKFSHEFFLNIGRLTNQKNQKILIDLFHNLIKKKKDLILYIIGDGEKKFKLLKKIKKLNLQNNIFLLGHKNNVFPYIKKAKAVIVSSLWEDPGAVMIETAFCNTPIISSNCPNGPNEFISNNHGGYLFKNNNHCSLENSLNLFLNESQKQIHKKKIFAKKKTKYYTIYNHFKLLNKILNA